MHTPKRPSQRVAVNRRRAFLFLPVLVLGFAILTTQQVGGIVTANGVFILGALISVSAAMAIVIDNESSNR